MSAVQQQTTRVAARAEGLRKVYGKGEASVTALDNVRCSSTGAG